jgi:hypothetical protein
MLIFDGFELINSYRRVFANILPHLPSLLVFLTRISFFRPIDTIESTTFVWIIHMVEWRRFTIGDVFNMVGLF